MYKKSLSSLNRNNVSLKENLLSEKPQAEDKNQSYEIVSEGNITYGIVWKKGASFGKNFFARNLDRITTTTKLRPRLLVLDRTTGYFSYFKFLGSGNFNPAKGIRIESQNWNPIAIKENGATEKGECILPEHYITKETGGKIFEVKTDARTFEMAVYDNECCKKWVELLNEASKINNESSHPEYRRPIYPPRTGHINGNSAEWETDPTGYPYFGEFLFNVISGIVTAAMTSGGKEYNTKKNKNRKKKQKRKKTNTRKKTNKREKTNTRKKRMNKNRI